MYTNAANYLGLATLCCLRSHSGGFPDNHNQVVALSAVFVTWGRLVMSPSRAGSLLDTAIFVVKDASRGVDRDPLVYLFPHSLT
jgi:hypothetical protein